MNTQHFPESIPASPEPAGLRILLIEDDPDDIRLLEQQLTSGLNPLTVQAIADPDALKAALAEGTWDIILSDYHIGPAFSALDALSILKDSGQDIPFILVTGAVGEEMAVAAMKAGASDYINKANTLRLVPVIEREREEKRNRDARHLAEAALRELNASLEQQVQERVAELERVNAALRQSEARLRRIYDSNILGICYWHVDGRVLEANDAMQHMVGYGGEEIRQGLVRWDKLTPPEYLARDLELMAAVRRGDWIPPYEKQIVHKDGHRVDCLICYTMLADEPDVGVGFLLDITERRKAQQALETVTSQMEALINNLPDVAWLKDHHSRFVIANEALAAYANRTREELIGLTDLDLWPRDLALHYRDGDQYVMRFGKELIVEEPIQSSDGQREIWVETIKCPVRNPQGEIIGIAGIARDITLRKEAEILLKASKEKLEQMVAERTAELAKANATLQENERLRSNFVSSLTHDLRTPLIAQKRLIELLQDLEPAASNDQTRILLQGLLKNNDNLLDMVNKLLETYQYVDGQIQLETAPFALDDLVTECFSELQELARPKHVTLQSGLASDLPMLLADRSLVKRVFVNLISNAIENIPDYCHVTISATPRDDRMEITVHDDGLGISPDILPNMFDRYFSRNNQARQKIGSGLGLFICKMVVELHGGHIRVESDPGQGATFYFDLPIAQAQAD